MFQEKTCVYVIDFIIISFLFLRSLNLLSVTFLLSCSLGRCFPIKVFFIVSSQSPESVRG